jgi:CubicO group peptidase (beta-lactamase class C family)/beta-glucosidase-like glycosyl hydrolase
MVKKVWFAVWLIAVSGSAFAQSAADAWVDSVFQTLSTEEKIGQLFMPKVSALTPEVTETLLAQIKQFQIGGILITGGGPVRHVRSLQNLQKKSKLPLLVGWGPAANSKQVTLDSLPVFPRPLAVSALQNEELVRKLGSEVARQMKLLGIHIYFGPQADIDLNAEVYPGSLDYFGTNKHRVAAKSWLFVAGLHEGGAISVVTHLSKQKAIEIPKVDSSGIVRLGIPDTTHFYPYQELMRRGVDGILTTNLQYTTTQGKETVPATLSELFIGDLIKKKLGYRGLIFTDVPLLQHRVEKPRGGETEILALQIGNDVLIDPKDMDATIKNLKKLLRKNKALQVRLDESVRKILAAKYKIIRNKTELTTDNLIARLNSTESQLLKRKLFAESLTLINNENQVLPIARLDGKKFAYLSIGREAEGPFSRMIAKHINAELIAVRSAQDTAGLSQRLGNYDHVITAVYPLATSFISSVLGHLYKFRDTDKLIIVHLGDPKQLLYFQDFATVLEGYTDDPLMQQSAAQAIFGALQSKGQLPLFISEKLNENVGYSAPLIDRFYYGLPEEAEMDHATLKQIDAIAREAIDSGATPGCHVLVARKGKVIFDQSYGWQTYENQVPVNDQTIYDLASVTKVSATLQAVMFLHEKGMIDLDKKAAVYLPELKDSNKKDFTLRDILTHQAGLWPFLPFWAQTVKDSVQMPEYYSYGQSEAYPYPVSDKLFATSAMKDSLWQWIIKAKVRDKIPRTPYDYRYSDMGFYILQHLNEKLLNQPQQDFLAQNLYEPLGAYTVGYLPLDRFPANQIAPTEDDKLFRRSLLRGYVHDQGAAMHGGVAGHAGLFGTANDLAKLGQLWLNGGHYGGIQFFKPETLETFTSKQFENSRRGLGWDKPTPSDWNGPTTLFASPKTFGHTGFTGTCVWVDPEFDLVFVFVSNRVHPDMTNNRLLNANIRPRIQEVIYRSIFNYCQYQH